MIHTGKTQKITGKSSAPLLATRHQKGKHLPCQPASETGNKMRNCDKTGVWTVEGLLSRIGNVFQSGVFSPDGVPGAAD